MKEDPQKKIMTRADSYFVRGVREEVWAIYEPFFLSLSPFMFESNEKTKAYTVDKNGTATIEIRGTILKNKEDAFWDETSQEEIRENFDAALADNTVKAIRFLVDSPGGVAQGVKELAEHIQLSRKTKKVYAEVDGMAASAAYWLASATGDVRATSSSSIGSIGVIYRHVDYTELEKLYGIQTTYITAGKYKALGAPKKLSNEDKEILQEKVDHIYDHFTSAVAKTMKLDIENKESWADGKIFFGDQAIENGLITKLLHEKAPQTAEKGNAMTEIATSAPVNAPQEVDIEKIKADAVAETKKCCVALAKVVLGDEASVKLDQALATGLSAEQFSIVKNLFGEVKVEKVQPAAQGDVDARVKAALSAILEGAQPATAIPQKSREKIEAEQREEWLKAAGNYRKEN